jgi:PIN domain nuclease of toxin-antitoxin system
MNLLLDTHIVLWWLANDAQLLPKTRAAIAGADLVYVSAVTGWEIAIKSAIGKLKTPGDFELQLNRHNFRSLPISMAHALAVEHLPLLHTDPFDRLLLCQANLERLTLVTTDHTLLAYGGAILLN